jgi:NADH-dependent peroxiredoxin subunit F
VLVVGGGPAGAAAAIYAARKGIRTGVAAERFGGQVLDTMAIENFISVRKPKARNWPGSGRARRQYEVDIMNNCSAPAPDPGARRLHEVQFWPTVQYSRPKRYCSPPARAGGR